MPVEDLTKLVGATPPAETPPAETPPAEPETPPAKPAETTPDDDGEEQSDLLAYIKDNFGEDLTKQFTDPDEALKSLVEARRLVGRRNEEAENWKELQNRLTGREQEFMAFLQGQPPEPAKPTKTDDEPVEWEQVEAWQAMVEAGKATPAVVAKLANVQKQLARTMFDLTYRRDKILSPEVEKRTKAIEDRLTQMTAGEQQRYQRQQLDNWAEQHKSVLYQNGDLNGGYTAIGKRAEEIFYNDEGVTDIPDPVKRSKVALKLAMAEQPKATTKKAPPKAKHQAAVAPTPTELVSAEDFFKKGGKLADYLAKQHAAMAEED